MLVLAGPGSGKTFTIIQRLLYLIKEKQVRQDSILVISFSKVSTLELKQRFEKQLKENFPSDYISDSKHSVCFSTFHACFFQILKEACHYTVQDIITEKQKRDILKIVLSDPVWENSNCKKEKKLKEQEEIGNINEKVEEYLQKISYYKNKGIRELKDKECLQFQKIYYAYNEEMHRQHKLDFDDMGLLCLQLFKNRPEVLEKWQRKYQYVMIDEFQDINMVQFRIIQLLIKNHLNLFVVGDDDQSIYGFRGASPQIMLDFKKYYPDCKQVLLETNYRCSKNIVEESLKVIEQNKVRLKKEIRAAHMDIHPSKKNLQINIKGKNGEKYIGSKNGKTKSYDVVYQGFEDYHKEYTYITDKIQKMVENGEYGYPDFACIFRTNRDMAGLAECLARNKIPFSMKENCSSIFQHFIAKDIMSYLSFFMEGRKRESFLRIMNKPLRYISRNALTDKVIEWKNLKKYYSSKSYMIKNIEALEQNDKWVQKLDLYGACYYIRKAIGYEEYIKEYMREQGREEKEALEILNFVQDSTKGMANLTEWRQAIEHYEEALKKAKNEENEGVQILTYHGCKGLEYPVVFLPDCNEGKVPHKKAAFPQEIEEERRMFYVAMTRAKQYLEILYIEDKWKKHLPPSRFLPLKNSSGERLEWDKLHSF